MIKDVARWEAWERQGPLREQLTPEQAFRLADAMYEYAKSLGAFPPRDPLEGIATKVAVARALNVQSTPQRIALNLDQSAIPYMVIGGQAVLIYGEPRLTRDVDITLGVGPERLPDLMALAESAGWQVLVEDPEEFVRQTMVLPLKDSETGIRMDLIFSFSPYERQAMERVKLLKMGKAEVRFAAVEDVIILKMVAGRVILRTYARFSPRTLTLGSGISGIGLPRLIVI